MHEKYQDIVEFVKQKRSCSSTEVFEAFSGKYSHATVKRALQLLIAQNHLNKTGSAKNTRYVLSPSWQLIYPVNLHEYYQKDIDERIINKTFNFQLIKNLLPHAEIFNDAENERLEKNQRKFINNINKLTQAEYDKEMERLAIDLSWKSSQIEGNTYSLLETEQLIKEKKTAAGKTREEATMLLNHKEAIDFILENPDYLYPLSLTNIENLHSILIKELAVSKNIRTKKVGISGTNYSPLDNEYQIKEAMNDMCKLVNNKKNVFEKALLALLLISYIQPFMDGNKRTARIVCNAVLLHHKCCPLSFRTVDSIDYKKAILLFYEINNLSAFKLLFMEQYEFAVNTYF
ncbi:MAG TPA: Fic family protein [Chitinophagaceae bacterium]|nr:Fic family protein [Chitinophagaceae bacterium]